MSTSPYLVCVCQVIGNPLHFPPPKDDGGTLTRQQQQTFEDTKV